MDKVIFTDIEHSDDNEIVISFCFNEGTQFGVGGFIIQRSPQYEYILNPYERGASIRWDDDDIIVLLDEVDISREQVRIKTKGKVQDYQFDLSELSDRSYDELIKHFYLLNFDHSIKLNVS